MISQSGYFLNEHHYGAAFISGLTAVILTILYVGFSIIREIRKWRNGD